MAGRSPHLARHEAPHVQRHGPVAVHQEHPPSSTLLLRGLARSVNDEMNKTRGSFSTLLTVRLVIVQILRVLQPFQPLQARTIYDKITGEPRGFAFVDFDSVESATEAVRAFESRPLVLQHRNVSVSFTDGFRHRSPEDDQGRPRGKSWGDRHNEPLNDPRQREQWQPRPDWICDECNVTNFARRTSCFQCNAPRTAQTKEVPVTAVFRQEHMRHNDPVYGAETRSRGDDDITGRKHAGGENARSVPPSQVLVVRMLPPDIEEGELHVVFAEFDGVQDIRLIRDRATSLSRGFGFIEFRDVAAATSALQKCDGLVVQNTHVEVSYARDTLSTRSHHVANMPEGPRAGSSLAATALEQAQWSLSQGRGAETATTDQLSLLLCYTNGKTLQQNTLAADVSALLDNAAAEVVPHFEEPKKMWPLPFETAGGSYVYVSEYGLYWEPESLFYYDAHTKVYYNSFSGAYYRCVDPGSSGAAAFQAFVAPVPVDDEVYNEAATVKTPPSSKRALSLSLKKDKKKAPGISFAIKTSAFAPAVPSENISKAKAAPAPAASASVASIGMKRKSADDIAKWSQRQREAKLQNVGDSSTATAQQPATGPVQSAPATSQTADSVIDALTNVPQEVPICLLCRRKFGSLEMLHKHEKLSKLHLTNLEKAKENKQHVAAQYREHEKEMERDAKKHQKEDAQSTVAAAPASKTNPEPPANSLESGIGGKLLKMMGWKSGDGLGKHGTGITAPIKAIGQGGRSDTAGLGCSAPLSSSVDLSDATTDKERRQRLARARYDATNA